MRLWFSFPIFFKSVGHLMKERDEKVKEDPSLCRCDMNACKPLYLCDKCPLRRKR